MIRLLLACVLLTATPGWAEQVEFLPEDVDVLAAVWHPDGRCVEVGLTRRREGRGVTLDVPAGAAWGGFPLVRMTPQVVTELRRAGATAVGLIDPKPDQLELLAAFPELEVLHLRNTRRLRDADLAPLAALARLRQLQLDQARHLTAAGLAPLAELDSLVYLGLREATRLDGAPLLQLAGSGLRDLDLSLCRGITSLAGAEALRVRSLRLDGCLGLGPRGLLGLGRLEGLRALSLRGCLVDQAVLEALPAGLRQLDLGLTYADPDDVVALLKRQPGLERLALPGCERLDARVAPALAGLSALRELDLREADWLDAAALAELTALPRLTRLDLSGADVLGADLATLAAAPALEHLALDDCLRLGPATGQALARLTKLVHLQLAGTALEDDALAPLAALTRLRTLDLSRSARLTDAALAPLVELPLERLNLAGCRRLTAGCVDALAKLQGLRQLDLVGAGVPGPALARLRAALPDCAIRSLE